MVTKGSRKFISKITAVGKVILKVKGTYEILNVHNFFPIFSFPFFFFPYHLLFFSLEEKKKSYALLGAD